MNFSSFFGGNNNKSSNWLSGNSSLKTSFNSNNAKQDEPKSIPQMIKDDDYIMFNQSNIPIIEKTAKELNKMDIVQKAADFQKYLTNIKSRLDKSFQYAELIATELIVFGLDNLNKDDYVAAAKALISSNPYSSTPPSALIKQLVRALVSAFFVRINHHDILFQFVKELESEDVECYLHCQLKRQVKIFTEDEMKQKSFTNIAIEIPAFLNKIIDALDKTNTESPKSASLSNENVNSPLCEAIIKDDVESLKKEIETSQPDFLKFKIDVNSNERCIFPKKKHPHQQYKQEKNDKPTLLEYAAFYGAEKCFKYLYDEKKCKITKHITKHALCGGNDYIYETILNSGKSFTNDLEYAIKFHHYDLFKKSFLYYYNTEYGNKEIAYNVVQKKLSESCIKFFNFQILRFLIEFGAEINDCMINQALKRDIHSLFIFLLGLNVDVNKQDKSDFAAIHCAIRAGNITAVQVLLANKKDPVDLNLGDHCGRTPIHFAAIVGNIEIFNILSNQPNVDLTRLDDEEMTPLHYAARQGKFDIVKQLITVNKIDPNCKNSAYMTPLHYACINGRIDIVKLLLEVPTIDVNPHDIGSWTPLHYAVDNNNIPIVTLLLENKNINPNVIDSVLLIFIFFIQFILISYDSTPLICACENNKEEIVNLLLKHPNVDVNACDNAEFHFCFIY